MKKRISFTLAMVLLLVTALPAFAASTVTNQTYGNLYDQFTDLKDANLSPAATAALSKAVDAGILKGNTAGELQPLKPTSGTELVIVMLRVLNLADNTPKGTGAIAGVPSWANNDVNVALESGLLTANDPLLSGGINRELTREEALIFIAKALNIKPDNSASPFKDSSDPYITALYNKGLVKGYGNGMLGADNTLTRAELAILIDRILQNQ